MEWPGVEALSRAPLVEAASGPAVTDDGCAGGERTGERGDDPADDPAGDAAVGGHFDEAARFVAALPNGPERLLGQHVAGDNGDCAGCGLHTSTRWPCALVFIARLAQRINHPSGRSGRAEPSAHG